MFSNTPHDGDVSIVCPPPRRTTTLDDHLKRELYALIPCLIAIELQITSFRHVCFVARNGGPCVLANLVAAYVGQDIALTHRQRCNLADDYKLYAWTCTGCTFLNVRQSSRCEVCRRNRGTTDLLTMVAEDEDLEMKHD